jgi:hypothetical protein
MPRFEGGEFTI